MTTNNTTPLDGNNAICNLFYTTDSNKMSTVIIYHTRAKLAYKHKYISRSVMNQNCNATHTHTHVQCHCNK